MFDKKLSNSFKSREKTNPQSDGQEKSTEEVAGEEQSSGRTGIVNKIFSESVNEMKSYFLCDILVPSMMRALDEVITKTKDIFFKQFKREVDRTMSRTPYERIYKKQTEESRSRVSYKSNGVEVIVPDREKVDEVLAQMDAIIDAYKVASIQDLLYILGKESKYTDCKYGWHDIQNTTIRHLTDGTWEIIFPKTIVI